MPKYTNEEINDKYLFYEKEYLNNKYMNIVLVSSDDIREAYPNYFGNTKLFLLLMKDLVS